MIFDDVICKQVEDKDEWFQKLDQGYIGIQSGNFSLIYFEGRDGYLRHISFHSDAKHGHIRQRDREEVRNAILSHRHFSVVSEQDLRNLIIKGYSENVLLNAIELKIPQILDNDRRQLYELLSTETNFDEALL